MCQAVTEWLLTNPMFATGHGLLLIILLAGPRGGNYPLVRVKRDRQPAFGAKEIENRGDFYLKL